MICFNVNPDLFYALMAWLWLAGVGAGVGLAMMAKEFRDG